MQSTANSRYASRSTVAHSGYGLSDLIAGLAFAAAIGFSVAIVCGLIG